MSDEVPPHYWNYGRNRMLVKFAGLDGHQVGIIKAHVNHLVSLSGDGKPYTNIYFHNGLFVSVKGTLEEVTAVFERGNEESDDKHYEHMRKIAERKRLGALEAERAIQESGINSRHYVKASQQVESDEHGNKTITVHMTKLTAEQIAEDEQLLKLADATVKHVEAVQGQDP